MTKVTVLCWQEIPAVVEAKDSTATHKVQLSMRFQELIDRVAMRRGLDGSDAYLLEWNKTRQPSRDEAAQAAASAVAGEIEARYDEIKVAALAKAKS